MAPIPKVVPLTEPVPLLEVAPVTVHAIVTGEQLSVAVAVIPLTTPLQFPGVVKMLCVDGQVMAGD